MNQWYRKTVTKAVVLLAGILGGAAFVTSLGIVTSLAGTVNPAEIMKMAEQPYEESGDFTRTVENMISEVFRKMEITDFFEQEGSYAPGKLVDIMEYSEHYCKVSGENTSGVAYPMEQLISWSGSYSSGSNTEENEIVVCQKQDGSYYYYYMEDFLARFKSGQFSAKPEDGYSSQAEFLSNLQNGTYISLGTGGVKIYDNSQDGALIYKDCWSFGQSLREKYAPEGAANLLEVVNNSEELNGKLSEVYSALEFVLNNISGDYESYQSGWEYLQEGNTNFTYLYVDDAAKKVLTNKNEYKNYSDAERNIDKMKSQDSVKYMVVYQKLKDFETNMNLSPSSEWEMVRAQNMDGRFSGIFAVAVDTSYPIQDYFYEASRLYGENGPMLKWSIFFLFFGGALFLVSVIWVTATAGRKEGDDSVALTAFDRWKTEPAAAAVILLWAVVTWGMTGGGFPGSLSSLSSEIAYYAGENMENLPDLISGVTMSVLGMTDIVVLFFYGVFTFACFFAGYMSLIRRIKAKIVWKGSLLYAVLSFGRKAVRSKSVTLTAAAGILGFLLLQWLAIVVRSVPTVLLSLAADGVAVWLVLEGAMAKARIKKGIEEIASGNMAYRIDLKGLRGTDLDLAEKVNDIGTGLNRAVDDAMKNERLKTDLITNVSHDIKTPLTSIINYVDILKRSDIADEKIRGYLDILEAKAQRLKTLTEDVVEASKVSSGNITLEYMDVDLRELIRQTEGELAEKFAARNLTLVLNMPEEPAVIHVDGRRMWRVLENVFGNAAKYAMPGTRVYADLTVDELRVKFSLKNMSEQQLNISADELTERFIRGDISRSTEGSGLGLSIAKSLTTMQGGEFKLYLDGDLFRVDIQFQRIKTDRKG